MLTITNVKKTFNKGTVNEKKALNGINLHLAPGDFVTIIGGNGAGKSTMLNMIAGVYPIDSGKIEIDGVNISREPEYKRAKYIGRVFQDPMRGTAANMEIQEILPWHCAAANPEDSAGASKRMKRTSTVRHWHSSTWGFRPV